MEAHVTGSWEGCQDPVPADDMRGFWEVMLWATTSQVQRRHTGQQSRKNSVCTPAGLSCQGLKTKPTLALNLDPPVSTSLELGLQVDTSAAC